MTREQACQTPLSDLRKGALAHYDAASTAAREWHSVIPRAINFYFDAQEAAAVSAVPESNGASKELRKWMADLRQFAEDARARKTLNGDGTHYGIVRMSPEDVLRLCDLATSLPAPVDAPASAVPAGEAVNEYVIAEKMRAWVAAHFRENPAHEAAQWLVNEQGVRPLAAIAFSLMATAPQAIPTSSEVEQAVRELDARYSTAHKLWAMNQTDYNAGALNALFNARAALLALIPTQETRDNG